jgi:diguanylate cyclase (GGDEF)-like protein
LTRAVPPPPPPERGRIGATPTVRSRLALQRPRPLLVRAYAAIFSDVGLVGAPARRRALRLLGQAMPFAVAGATGALVVRGAFDVAVPGWGPTLATGALAVALGATVWRRTVRAASGDRASAREQLELGALFVVAAYAMTRTASGGAAESPLQPLVYLVMAFLVAFLGRPVGFSLVVLAVGLELLVWRGRGAHPAELTAAVVHSGFVTLFAVLYHAVLAAQVASLRRTERGAVERRLREIEERAREFRLLAPGADAGGAGPADREQRWREASVIEVETAVRGALEIAEVALRTHTCAVFTLSDDDRELTLRECRSKSDAVQRAPLPAGEGALGGAVRRRAPVRLHGDLKGMSYYVDGTRPGALLAMPLVDRRGDHVRGVVVADRLEAAPFTDEDERLLATLSAEILRAVAAERLIADMKHARDEKERFYGAIERLNKTTKPVEVFQATLEAARGMVPVDFGAMTLVEGGDARRVHRVAHVLGGEAASARLEGLEFGDEGGGLVAAAVRLQSSLPAKFDSAKAVVFDPETRLKGISSLKVIPLRSGDRVLGTMVLGARVERAYEGDVVRQLEVVAMQAGDAILRANLFAQTERLATTDGLTGLTNHRTFQARLDEQLAVAERYGKKVSLILCDIDHFKSVNDTYGHPTGDVVLKGVARALAQEARQTDVTARYGGEEFAVVMPETDTAGAEVIAERIRAKVGALVFETEQGPLRVTMSLGVATFPDDGAQKPALVERADGCLYHAKRHGRNQTVTAAALRGPRRATA